MELPVRKYANWVVTVQETEKNELPLEVDLEKLFKANCSNYVFQKEAGTQGRIHYQCAVKFKTRKTFQAVMRLLTSIEGTAPSNFTITNMLGTWEQNVDYCTKHETKIGPTFSTEKFYEPNDLKIMEDPSKRYPWQNSIINLLIEEVTGTIKAAGDREILWIEDPKGRSGKSKLIKWLCFNYTDVAKVSFGTSAQLRSALISAGIRKIYFIDVPRTLGDEDSMRSLMSVLEDLKNGFVVSTFYGSYATLMLEPPHIVVVSNANCEKKYLSEDRWVVFKINSNMELTNEQCYPMFTDISESSKNL